MDYSNIIEELDKATLFDLYRLQVAISSEVSSHARVQKVKNTLQVGQEITWLDDTTNRLEKAIIRKLTKTRCEVENSSDGEVWRILYASINLDACEVDIKTNQKVGVKKSALKVGDIVSFKDNEHKLQFAKVEKLNPKTAGVITTENRRWRVSYEMLQINRDLEAQLHKQEEIAKQKTLLDNTILEMKYD